MGHYGDSEDIRTNEEISDDEEAYEGRSWDLMLAELAGYVSPIGDGPRGPSSHLHDYAEVDVRNTIAFQENLRVHRNPTVQDWYEIEKARQREREDAHRRVIAERISTTSQQRINAQLADKRGRDRQVNIESEIRSQRRHLARLEELKERHEALAPLRDLDAGSVVYFTKELPSKRVGGIVKEKKTYHYAAVRSGDADGAAWHVTGAQGNLAWVSDDAFIEMLEDAKLVGLVQTYRSLVGGPEEVKGA